MTRFPGVVDLRVSIFIFLAPRKWAPTRHDASRCAEEIHAKWAHKPAACSFPTPVDLAMDPPPHLPPTTPSLVIPLASSLYCRLQAL